MTGYVELTPEQLAVRDMVRDFAAAEIAPHAGDWDRTETFPTEVIKQLGKLGVMGLPFPEEYGGVGAGSLALALALEELAHADSSVAVTVSASVGLAGYPIWKFGTEEQKRQWLEPLAAGRTLGAYANTEADAGSDVQGLRTTARLDGDSWILNGAKAYITNAGTELSAFTLTTAVTGKRDDGRSEISTILVPGGTPGFEPQKPYRKMGWHASDTRELVYRECAVPAAMLLGSHGEGTHQFLATVEGGRIGIGAMAVGLGQACLDLALEWVTTRRAFGQAIGHFQGVAFQLAELKAQVEAARGLVYRAAAMRDAERPFGAEAAQAKLFASEVAVKAADVAMQLHGGYGFMEESPIPRHYRDAKVLTIGEGTSEILKLVIARSMGLDV